MKKWTYTIGLLALGFVIFNNLIQTVEAIKINQNYMIGLAISMVASIIYGILNIKN